MAILSRFTIPHACGCCPGDGPYLVVGECQSLTGTATLCGFSGFNSDSAPYDGGDPWAWEGQLRKWQQRRMDGEISTANYWGADCATDPVCSYLPVGSPGFTNTHVKWEGAATRTCAGTTLYTVTVDYAESACAPASYSVDVYQISTAIPEDAGLYTKATTLTERSWTSPGCVATPTHPAGRGSVFIDGIASETLQAEQFLYDALATLAEGGSEDVVAGGSCCASLSSAALTTPESFGGISLSGTAVRVPLTIFGCSTIGAEMTAYVQLLQGEDEYIVETVLLCLVPGFFHVPLPPPGDTPVCFVAASLSLDGPWVTPRP